MWSPTLSENGKTSPYMEPDSQVTADYSDYSGFTGAQVKRVSSHFNLPTYSGGNDSRFNVKI